MITEFDQLEQRLLAHPGAFLDYPFGPTAAVFKVMGKMFALVAWQAEPLSISLKCDPEDALQFRAMHDAITPGYHLNKRHWNTVTLNGSVPDELVEDMIDASYELVVRGLGKADRIKLEASLGLGPE